MNGELQSPATETMKSRKFFRPAVDIFEKETELLLIADVPGAATDGIDIQFEKGILTITAEVAERIKGSGVRPLRQEYEVGAFRRSFEIGEKIDTDRISAKLSHGVLEVVLPKRAEAQPKKIVVQNA
jgi:HSP20 family molecular chaperone IbpA